MSRNLVTSPVTLGLLLIPFSGLQKNGGVGVKNRSKAGLENGNLYKY
jgi:hypothetical protein